MIEDLSRRRILGIGAGGLVVAGAAGMQPALASAIEPALRTVTLNGTKLAYQRHTGAGRRPLIFLHGYALRGTGGIYSALIGSLLAEHEVFALDMRGHGGSAMSIAGWSQATIADDLADFVRALGLERPAFAGHSLGAFTGLYAQIRRPGTFSSLALLSTAAASGGGAPASVRDAFMTKGRDRDFLRTTFAAMYRRPRAVDLELAVDAVTLVDPRVHDAFYSNFAATRIDGRLGEIDVPVLLINGAKDNVVPPLDQYRTALGIARAREITLPDEGHMLPIEAPDMVAREMLTFR